MLEGACHCGRARWRYPDPPGTVTSCNCSLCRRYGALWAYGEEGERLGFSGETHRYWREDLPSPGMEIVFCRHCATVLGQWHRRSKPDGRRRLAVNMRLAAFEAVADIPVRQLDGLESEAELPWDGRRVRDLWF